jgi:hypothetical protein
MYLVDVRQRIDRHLFLSVDELTLRLWKESFGGDLIRSVFDLGSDATHNDVGVWSVISKKQSCSRREYFLSEGCPVPKSEIPQEGICVR